MLVGEMSEPKQKRQKLEKVAFDNLPSELKFKILMSGTLDKPSLNTLKHINHELYDIIKDPIVRKEQCLNKRDEWSMLKTPGNILSYMYENPHGTLILHTTKAEMYTPELWHGSEIVLRTYVIYWDLEKGSMYYVDYFSKEGDGEFKATSYPLVKVLPQKFDAEVKKFFKVLFSVDDTAILGTDQKTKAFEFRDQHSLQTYTSISKLLKTGINRYKVDPMVTLYDFSFLSHRYCKDILNDIHTHESIDE